MSQYLSSIKQWSTLIINNEELVVSFNLDSKSDEQNELISSLTLETESEAIKNHFNMTSNKQQYIGNIEQFNNHLASLQ